MNRTIPRRKKTEPTAWPSVVGCPNSFTAETTPPRATSPPRSKRPEPASPPPARAVASIYLDLLSEVTHCDPGQSRKGRTGVAVFEGGVSETLQRRPQHRIESHHSLALVKTVLYAVNSQQCPC